MKYRNIGMRRLIAVLMGIFFLAVLIGGIIGLNLVSE